MKQRLDEVLGNYNNHYQVVHPEYASVDILPYEIAVGVSPDDTRIMV
jgi:hypothetical protein